MSATLSQDDLEAVLADLISYQQRRVIEHARRINPRLTEDDLKNPIDFPALNGNAAWNYEDGILAGYRSVQTAIRARLKGR